MGSKSETLTEIQSPNKSFLKKYELAQSKLDQLADSLNDFRISSSSQSNTNLHFFPSKRMIKSKSACITVSSPPNKSSNVFGQKDHSPITHPVIDTIAHLKP